MPVAAVSDVLPSELLTTSEAPAASAAETTTGVCFLLLLEQIAKVCLLPSAFD